MMNCPQCGQTNMLGAAFCDNCGASLAGAAAPAAQAASSSAGAAGGANCPSCGASVIPGEAFCGDCGAALSAVQPQVPSQQYPPQQQGAPQTPPQTPPASYPSPQAPPQQPQQASSGATCQVCGTPNQPGQAFCDNCGASLQGQSAGQSPGAVSPPPAAHQPPQSYPSQGGYSPAVPSYGAAARLVVASSGHSFDLSGKQEALIGREDPVSDVFPEVDLTNHGGLEGGVSRRHAKLSLQGNQWVLEAFDTANATLVNTTKIAHGTRHPLSPGDTIRLGKVMLNFQSS